MEEIKKEETKFTKEQKMVIGGMVTSAGVIGFVLGDRHRLNKTAHLIDKMVKVDPTFWQHWCDALGKMAKSN